MKYTLEDIPYIPSVNIIEKNTYPNSIVALYWRPNIGASPNVYAYCHLKDVECTESGLLWYRENRKIRVWFKMIDGMYMLHRDDGPAIEYASRAPNVGDIVYNLSAYYRNGVGISEEEVFSIERRKQLSEDLMCLSDLHE